MAGIVYCAVVLECMKMFDLGRATEWTGALDRWSASEPDIVPYRGECLVHQSQLQQAEGDWSRPFDRESACERLTDPPHPGPRPTCYQAGELHRFRGEFDAAADAYARASRARLPADARFGAARVGPRGHRRRGGEHPACAR